MALSRVKTWSAETLTASDLNAEFNNILNYLNGSGVTLNGPVIGGILDLTGASGGQIKFPSVQNASSDANTLDDYKEGTWTATDASGANLSLTSVYGLYTKIGRLVFVSGGFAYPSTADTSAAIIGGLPYTVLNTAAAAQANGAARVSNVTDQVHTIPIINTKTFRFMIHNGNQQNQAMSSHAVTFSLAYTT